MRLNCCVHMPSSLALPRWNSLSHHYFFRLLLYSSLSADPFMYYSIPGVRKASILLKDVDYSDITSLGHSSSSSGSRRSSRQSETSQQEAVDHPSDGEKDAIKVSRTSRVSFECHPCVLMEDFMTDLELEFDEEELSRLDDIVTLITSLHRQ